MDQVIVSLDGKDHKIGQGEHTVCGIPVPHGTPREEGAKPCPTCFPKDEVEPEPEPVFSIAVDPETLGKGQDPDEPVEAEFVEDEKPKKATKAK